ncbi:DapH/DapD/GlmU-related protein [uncultured Psychroserpens sp.]|uniref:DapH/DapD/GlmU-related protein n=1 Tax=uncultured Psychroserpens sp. TaxID=255436 RepID=UPI002615F873|nr:DapH/DapD/GlmU-related protein [uncultured Psychroserpens sp.]
MISDKATIGKNVEIGPYCVIEDDVVIGDNTVIKSYVELRKGTVIGKNCLIDSRVSSSGDNWIGDHVIVRYDSILARGLKIGDHSYICPRVMTNNLNTNKEQIGGADIGKNVFIGTNCVIHHGISIGDNCILGALSYVNKNIPNDEVWFGNPAKFQRKV